LKQLSISHATKEMVVAYAIFLILTVSTKRRKKELLVNKKSKLRSMKNIEK
jgi:hypothetical protein